VERLRLATRQLASGDLNVGCCRHSKGDRMTWGLLAAADLDTMAERCGWAARGEAAAAARDVSHELRSPLARLQLALSLARREDGGVERPPSPASSARRSASKLL